MSVELGTQYCVYPLLCSYYGDAPKEFTCSNSVITRYQKRIPAPMLDQMAMTLKSNARPNIDGYISFCS
jgi:hypothetical protein